jgi:hypothetical protein
MANVLFKLGKSVIRQLSALIGISLAALLVPAMAQDATLSKLLNSGTIQAKVMRVGAPLEAQKMAERLQSALVSQPDWAKTYIASALPGQALPYHPNLKVTEDEYKSFLAAIQRLELVQVGIVNLSAVRLQNGDIRLVTEPNASRVNGLTLSSNGTSVTTPLAMLTEISQVNNQDKASVTGRWTGKQWRYASNSSTRQIVVRLAIGNRPDYGDDIIYYNHKDAQKGQLDDYDEVLLFRASK